MAHNYLHISAKMAIILGGLLPWAETIRRANQLFELANFFKWFDDYMLGFILVIVAYRAIKKKKESIAYLIAAWGMAAGGLSLSFLGQFAYYETPAGDPGLFPTTFVLIVKGIILLYVFIGLKLSIKANKIATEY
jgi:hypothetical protein